MKIKLSKLTPLIEESKEKCKAFADFDISYKELSFKIKGCHIIYIPKTEQYIVKLPTLKTTKGALYT